MRRLEILNQVHLTFSGRGSEFDLGVEIGAVSVLMAQGEAMIVRCLTQEGIEQVRPIADRFRYNIATTSRPDGLVDLTLIHRRHGRPRLRVV